MRQLALMGVVLASISGLAACGQDDPEPQPGTMIGHQWQVTNLYLEPDAPSDVSGAAGGAVTIVFGETSATGSTGCAPIQASIDFLADGSPAHINDATAVRFTDVRIPDPAGVGVDCAGQRAWTDDSMRFLLSDGHVFDIHHPTQTEAVLTLQTSGVDRPAMRLAAL